MQLIIPSLSQVRREQCRRSFHRFVIESFKELEPETTYVDNWHIADICDTLQDLVEGRASKRNLIINVPPGSMKSLIVSVFLVPWIWLKRPSFRAINISASNDLALQFSVTTRDFIYSDWYQSFEEVTWSFKEDQNTKSKFDNTAGGWRYAVSTGKAITGWRGDAIIVDDGNDAADVTDATLERVSSCWDRGQANRLRTYTKGIRIVIQQRVHEKDLTGHILSKQDKSWDKIIIRSLFEQNDPDKRPRDPRTKENELLSPILQPQEYIDGCKEELLDYGFSGFHQQRPTPRTGGMFDVDKIVIVDYLPPTIDRSLIHCRAWDFAYTQDGGDATASAYGFIDRDNTNLLYILDVTNERVKDPLTEYTRLLELDPNDTHVRVPRDPGGGNRTADAAITLGVGHAVSSFRPTIKKEVTWIPLSNWVNAGRVRLLKGHWNEAFKSQLGVAPRGKHDDMIDAATELYSYLSQYGTQDASFDWI